MDVFEKSSNEYEPETETDLMQLGFFKAFENKASQDASLKVSDLPDLSLKLDIEENFERSVSYSITPLNPHLLKSFNSSFLSPNSVREITASLKQRSPLLPITSNNVDVFKQKTSPEESTYRLNEFLMHHMTQAFQANRLANTFNIQTVQHSRTQIPGFPAGINHEITRCSPQGRLQPTFLKTEQRIFNQGNTENLHSIPCDRVSKELEALTSNIVQVHSTAKKKFGRKLEFENDEVIQGECLLRNPYTTYSELSQRLDVSPGFSINIPNFSPLVMNDFQAFLRASPKCSESSARKPIPVQNTSSTSLKTLSQKVKEIVEERSRISYRKVVEMIAKEIDPDLLFQLEEGDVDFKQNQNLKRRVYDSLNVLVAAGVLKREGEYVSCKPVRVNSDARSLTEINQNKSALLCHLNLSSKRVLKKKEALRKCALQYLTVRNLIALNNQSAQSSETKIAFPFIVVSAEAKSMSLSMSANLRELAISSGSMINVCGDVEAVLKIPRCKVSEETLSEFLGPIPQKKQKI